MSDVDQAPPVDAASAFFVEAFEPRHRADPYPLYRRMRDGGPFVSADTDLHLAFAHADCWALLRDPAASSDERRSTVVRRGATTDPRLAALLEDRPLLVFMDPPDHTRLRSLVAQAFTPRRVEHLRASIEVRAQRLVDDLAGSATGGVVDLMEHLASPLPIGVICDLLGIPASDRDRFTAWSAAMARSVDPAVLRSEADELAIATAGAELHDYSSALLAERRRRPSDDLLSDVVVAAGAATSASPLDDELADLVTLLLVAGHETTVNLIGNGVVALLDAPEQLALWRDDPTVAATGIDELLRFDSPLQMVQRIATREAVIGGARVDVGDQIVVVLGAANRDPAAFHDPDRLDLRRPNAHRHVSFGGGIHHCLGAALARVEGIVAITELLRRHPRIRAAGPAPVRPTFTLRGRSALPVVLDAG